MCFHSNDKEEISELIAKLKDDYTIQSSTGDRDGQEEAFIENSKLFICFLSLNFLNDFKCMEYLKLAFKFKKKIFILENNNGRNFSTRIKNKKNFDRSNSTSLIYSSQETDRNVVKKNIHEYFK